MNSAKIISLPNTSAYGAAEIKEFIRINTYRAFLLTFTLIIALFTAYFYYGKSHENIGIHIFAPPFITSSGNWIIPQDPDIPVEPPINIAQFKEFMTKYQSGTPVPMPEAQAKEDLGTFAPFEELNRSLPSKHGMLVSPDKIFPLGDLGKDIIKKEVPANPDSEELPNVEKEPQLDMSELQKNVIYPELARKVGAEGKVVVRVLVGKDGLVKKSLIQYSASSLLDQAAIDAVRKTVFIPAIQNNVPVPCWISIPIQFRLK